MHSKIYQIGLEPMTVENYVHPDFFYENSSDFADYIGNEIYGDIREEFVKHLSDLFPGVLEYVAKSTLRYKGVSIFTEQWVKEIKGLAKELTPENLLKDVRRLHFVKVLKKTHMCLDSRFFIENWNGYAGPASDLIGFLSRQRVETLIYVGSVIDFHW
jgi:hypothetical protein